MIKRFDIVKIVSKGDIYFKKIGVVVSISKSSTYPYGVCFGIGQLPTNELVGLQFQFSLRG